MNILSWGKLFSDWKEAKKKSNYNWRNSKKTVDDIFNHDLPEGNKFIIIYIYICLTMNVLFWFNISVYFCDGGILRAGII